MRLDLRRLRIVINHRNLISNTNYKIVVYKGVFYYFLESSSVTWNFLYRFCISKEILTVAKAKVNKLYNVPFRNLTIL